MIVLLVVNHKVDSIKERGVRRPARSSSRRASAAQRPCRVGPRRAPFRSRRQTFLGFSIAKRNEFQDLACTNTQITSSCARCTVLIASVSLFLFHVRSTIVAREHPSPSTLFSLLAKSAAH